MKRRWGSYSRKTGRVCLNLELIKASRYQIDYVITHELCHIRHAAHDQAFYRQLNAYLPDWKRAKTGLETPL
ncbi:MAG: M48 family metallopeptidase [Kiritimatiellales bacterium]